MHVVFATDAEGTTWRVSDNLSWGQAQSEWKRLDDTRMAGLMPHIKFFEVRSNLETQPRFAEALVGWHLLRVAFTKRGFRSDEDAARIAWKHTYGDRFHDRRWDDPGDHTGVQGRGGWFYYPNGMTAAQGLGSLAKLAKRMNLMMKGVDGRWHVMDADLDATNLRHVA